LGHFRFFQTHVTRDDRGRFQESFGGTGASASVSVGAFRGVLLQQERIVVIVLSPHRYDRTIMQPQTIPYMMIIVAHLR
jgi:hypothetical protein